MTGENFWEERRPAAILKHGVLKRYLRPFAHKLASRSYNHHVAYIDGYAGPGNYEDGSPGSPELALQVAQAVVESKGAAEIDGYFVERDKESFLALREHFARSGAHWDTFHGEVEEYLPRIVKSLNPKTALFSFLDPFGLGIPLAMIDRELLSRSNQVVGPGLVRAGAGAPTEVLLNFSYAGLRRRAGHLDNNGKSARYLRAAQTMIDRMDATLGGNWWHAIWRTADPNEREQLITMEYCRRLQACAGGWHAFPVNVSNGVGKRPAYSLVLVTQHPDGLWLFNNAVSSSVEEWRTECFDLSGELDFEPLPYREDEWVIEIKRAITARLASRGGFEARRDIVGVYGGALGLAREKHVRRALNELYAEGVTRQDGKGNVSRLFIRPR